MADKFTWETTGDEIVAKFADLIKGKIILITGVATNSLGAETAVAVSKAQPKLIMLHARSEDKIAPIAAQVQAVGVPTKSVIMNLASLASVRQAAEKIASDDDVTIDVLINCAGIMATPYGKTEDGFEQQFGINHLSHFLFTNLLLKAGKISNGGRIVNVSSGGHMSSGIRWDDVNFSDGAAYEKYLGYGQSKTGNVLFSVALADKLKSRKILSYSLTPGIIHTNLGRHQSEEEIEFLMKLVKERFKDIDTSLDYRSLNQGVSTQIFAAFSPSIIDQNGGYLYDCQIKPAAPHATSLEDANRLWALSEDMVGEKFAF
ncbi:hypothetical protein H072_7820 [Dactylellina haptotyla CBS 200.50]|uniref:Short-chain dehydrogenase n=1 Tax=Dactylellina haptotyla (strain CBS 200.50) TaxID=1284197 RepID=S8A605_DACHA|nr:hypothetical protein H072_7820 [Dactylellina haptotyla CBS 200.50]